LWRYLSGRERERERRVGGKEKRCWWSGRGRGRGLEIVLRLRALEKESKEI